MGFQESTELKLTEALDLFLVHVYSCVHFYLQSVELQVNETNIQDTIEVDESEEFGGNVEGE